MDRTIAHCPAELSAAPDDFPFREAVAMAVDDRITESVSKVALLAAALRLRIHP